VICKLQQIYVTGANRYPCCQLQSGLFSASPVIVQEAHEYMRAIQPCNTNLYCIVVTSSHCVLHRRLAIILQWCTIEWAVLTACSGSAVGSVAVCVAWLQWPTGLGSRLSLARSFVSGYSSICFEIKFSGRHRGFDGVFFKLWLLANTVFRGTQSLIPANRWRTTACSGKPLMALFTLTDKLGSGAYGVRHAGARPSVM